MRRLALAASLTACGGGITALPPGLGQVQQASQQCGNSYISDNDTCHKGSGIGDGDATPLLAVLGIGAVVLLVYVVAKNADSGTAQRSATTEEQSHFAAAPQAWSPSPGFSNDPRVASDYDRAAAPPVVLADLYTRLMFRAGCPGYGDPHEVAIPSPDYAISKLGYRWAPKCQPNTDDAGL